MTRLGTAAAAALLLLGLSTPVRASVVLAIEGVSDIGAYTGTIEFDPDAPLTLHSGYGQADMIGLKLTITVNGVTYSDSRDYSNFDVSADYVQTGEWDPDTRNFGFLTNRHLVEDLGGGLTHFVDQRTEITILAANDINTNDVGKSWRNLLNMKSGEFRMFRGEGLYDSTTGESTLDPFPDWNSDISGTITSVTLITPEPSTLAAAAFGSLCLAGVAVTRRRARGDQS